MQCGKLVACTICLVGVGFVNGQSPTAGQPDSGRAGVSGDSASAPSSDLLGWTRADYLWWRVKDAPVPVPLATRGGAFPGGTLIGTPGSTVVLGGQDVDLGAGSGARLSGGLWLNAERTLSVESSAFLLGKMSTTSAVGSNTAGVPALSRPFIDATTGLPAAFAIASPGLFAGNLSLDIQSRLWGADTNVRFSLCNDCCVHVEGLAGIRYLGLDEKLAIEQRLAAPLGAVPVLVPDGFQTLNQFFGAQVGAAAEYCYDRWFVAAVGKIAAGSNCYRVEASNGGVLVGPTNRGDYTDTVFSWASEAEVRVGCQLNGCVRAYVGYNCLYWSGVARPGDQIDPVINPATLFGVAAAPARPAMTVRDTDFWAHGVSIGVEVRY